MKQLSVGTILTDNNNILLGHATLNKKWDIPKGLQEENETYIQTAQRELKEEFGLYEPEFRFETLGLFEYLKNKDLYLFKIYFSDLKRNIPLSYLRCNSYFEFKKDKYPEIDAYKIIALNDIDNYCYDGMIKVLNKIFKIKE